MTDAILALDMGGTNIKGGLFGQDALPLTQTRQVSVNSFGTQAEILHVLGGFVRELGKNAQVTAVAVSTPGPFRYDEGVSDMTKKYAAIRGIPLREEIRLRGDLAPDVPVTFLSDANAYLLGEWLHGAGKKCPNCAAVTLGTGLGYSVMEDGAVLVNENGRPYDILCYMPFRDGVLENLASGTGVAREYQRRTGKPTTAREMAQMQDAVALDVFAEMGEALGAALAPRMRKHHTQRLVVGGQMAYSMDLFRQPLAKPLEGTAVVAAENIPDAALYGAAAHALKLDGDWRREIP